MHRTNKRKSDARGNAEDADTGASGSRTVPTETSSGGSSSLIGNCYEVFLSFRGPDTRYGFTDHLYHGLRDTGIHVFRDDDELPHGEKIGPELTAAITNSPILIPILSETYGTSGWCLDELVQIMERKNNNGQMVLPIFYKVKPAEVRYQTGKFGDEFHERETRLLKRSSFDPTILEKWKKALDEVGTLKGYEAAGYEGELVKSIIQKVLSELKKEYELVIPENLVGIDAHVKNVMKIVDSNSSATLFIGIHGMGGIGKTTLATTIYKKLSSQFMYRSFIADIRESYKRDGPVYLQNQLIFDILKREHKVPNEYDGINFISSKLKNKKVLILLDDADDFDQLKILVGEHNWFSSGSRVLITTRNSSILDGIRVDHKYEHKVMNKDDSMDLFCRHAFRRSSPPDEFKDLVRDVITTTGGLPLSLEVLGSLLCGKKPPFWRGTIDKLKKVPHEKVQRKLRVSYDALDKRQKQFFLDIACFFIGTDRRIATYMWDAHDFYPGEGIEVLIFMSLIRCGDDHVLWMHDHLRDLGREIVCEENQGEPRYRSRLWDSKEARKVLQKNQGTNKIEAIDLSEDRHVDQWEDRRNDQGEDPSDDEWEDHIYRGEQFKSMTHVRFLRMEEVRLSGDFENSMEELKWLQWKRCPRNFEVTNFPVKELVILELLNSVINEEWEGWRYFKMAERLKILNLSKCSNLKNTGFLSAFNSLEVLILYSCDRLERIDSSIRELKTLRRLDLCGCFRVRELPAEIGGLKALEQLLLRNTRALSALPDNITSLENLEVLDLTYSGIEELPIGFGTLGKLRELNTSSYWNPKGLRSKNEYGFKFAPWPELPPSLTYLNITCKSRTLPSLSHLVHLKQLRFWDCQSLECIELPSALSKTSECSQLTDVEESELTQSLNSPFELEYLDVTDCRSIETLDVSGYIRLRALHIENCENLLEVRGIDKLIYLETLYVKSCNSIKKLCLPESKSRKHLEACRCFNIAEIHGIDRLEFLTNLRIAMCISLERLLLPESKSLTYLRVENCRNLVEIQGIDRLDFFTHLDIEICTSLKRLVLPESKSLTYLCVEDCHNLVEIQGINRLEFLTHLHIAKCTSLKMLLSESKSLTYLCVANCHNLVEIQGIDRLEFLTHLHIAKCASLKMLILESKSLAYLCVENCHNLVEIQGIDRSEFLTHLHIAMCTSLKRLLLPESKSLKHLEVRRCFYIAEIQGIDRLEFLTDLIISRCFSLKMLLLPKSESLKRLNCCFCWKLTEVKGLHGLKSLEKLDVSQCTLIKRVLLPESGNLKKLDTDGCTNLAEIEGLDGLEFLEELCIARCTSIERVHLPKSRSLKKLVADGCTHLAEIEGLDGLEFLEELCIARCTSIERVHLPKSRSLKKLVADGCTHLAEIEDLDGLEFLEELCIARCTSIERVLLPKSWSLKKLVADGCTYLAEIEGLDELEFLEELCIARCTSIERVFLSKFRILKKLVAHGCTNLAEIEGLNGLEFLEVLNICGCTLIKRLGFPESGRLENLFIEGCENLVEIQGLNKLEFLRKIIVFGCKSLKTTPNYLEQRLVEYDVHFVRLEEMYSDD